MATIVGITPCAGYAPEVVAGAVELLLRHLGGIGRFVAPGQTVLLKPNLLTDREPERAVTTHPEIVRALVRIVRGRGGKPVVADSPANVTKIERVWERTGFEAMCRQEDVPLLNLEKAGSVEVAAGGLVFTVAKPVLDADVVINVPKVKTHMLTVFTGAVKNLYGTIPGFQKTHLHKVHPTPREFGNLLAHLYGRIRPALSVADAVVGMEGQGPSGGIPVKLGFLAASEDGAALDTVLCRLLGIDPGAVFYLRRIRDLSLGETGIENIRILGVEMRDVAPKQFRLPPRLPGRLIPGRLVKWMMRLVWIRPAFTDRCVSCGRCVKACPAGALTLEKGRRPELAGPKCISCCCCHEVCPEQAVEMTMSPLLAVFRRGRLP